MKKKAIRSSCFIVKKLNYEKVFSKELFVN